VHFVSNTFYSVILILVNPIIRHDYPLHSQLALSWIVDPDGKAKGWAHCLI